MISQKEIRWVFKGIPYNLGSKSDEALDNMFCTSVLGPSASWSRITNSHINPQNSGARNRDSASHVNDMEYMSPRNTFNLHLISCSSLDGPSSIDVRASHELRSAAGIESYMRRHSRHPPSADNFRSNMLEWCWNQCLKKLGSASQSKMCLQKSQNEP